MTFVITLIIVLLIVDIWHQGAIKKLRQQLADKAMFLEDRMDAIETLVEGRTRLQLAAIESIEKQLGDAPKPRKSRRAKQP